MNTYNENLRSSIVTTLDQQKTALQKLEGQLGAQEISLYYAQGALISANDKFDDTLQMYEDQQDILASINENNNVAINVANAANQEKTYVDQAVSNTAVAAANVQIASNAILKLAGDIGNVWSIVNAADYQTQIFEETTKAKKNMNVTAYNAELATRFAMESSALVSSISSSTVLTEAQSTGAALTALNDSYKAQFEKTAAALDTENKAVVSANNLEKKAEGLTEDLSAVNYGMTTAYELNNLELNSGLRVLDGKDVNGVPYQTADSFSFEFHPYLTPLYTDTNGAPLPAVDEYYILVVETASKATFSTASAETAINGTLASGKNMFVKIDPASNSGGHTAYSEMVNTANIAATNGKDVALGMGYCLFLYIKMNEAYKKTINNYEDVLSAGSQTFELTKELTAVSIPAANIPEELSAGGTLQFTVTQKKEYNMEYRVMFLPASRDKVGNMLSDANIPTVKERDQLKRVLQGYQEALDAANSTISRIETANDELVAGLEKDIADAKATAAYKDANSSGKKAILKPIEEKISAAAANRTKNLVAPTIARDENQASIESFTKDKVQRYQMLGEKGIFFNLALAEQVPTGLYTVAANIVEEGNNTETPAIDSVSGTFNVTLGEDTTDNYGNKLNANEDYTPVVLSYSTAEASEVAQFSNSLSDFAKTKSFKFS